MGVLKALLGRKTLNPTVLNPQSTMPYLEVQGVVISGVISPLIWVISTVTLLITLLIITHEPPSSP